MMLIAQQRWGEWYVLSKDWGRFFLAAHDLRFPLLMPPGALVSFDQAWRRFYCKTACFIEIFRPCGLSIFLLLLQRAQ